MGAVYCLLVCLVIGTMFIVVICKMISYLLTPSLMQNTSLTLLSLVLKAERTFHIFLFFFPIFHYRSGNILIPLFHICLWRHKIDIKISIISSTKGLL